MKINTLEPDLLRNIDAHWRAANDLSVGQIYVCDFPLRKFQPTMADVNHMLLGIEGGRRG